MEAAGYRTGSFEALHHSSDDDDDDMVDIAGGTLDFSNSDDVPPLNSGNCSIFNLRLELNDEFVEIYSGMGRGGSTGGA